MPRIWKQLKMGLLYEAKEAQDDHPLCVVRWHCPEPF